MERTSAIGSNKEAAITGLEGEREIIDERCGSRRRLAVDSRVRESQTVGLYRWLWILLPAHFLRYAASQREGERLYRGRVREFGDSVVGETESVRRGRLPFTRRRKMSLVRKLTHHRDSESAYREILWLFSLVYIFHQIQLFSN
jgi:hypothetical protein